MSGDDDFHVDVDLGGNRVVDGLDIRQNCLLHGLDNDVRRAHANSPLGNREMDQKKDDPYAYLGVAEEEVEEDMVEFASSSVGPVALELVP